MFIVFEGLDGSGSTTQAKMLTERLEERNIAVLHTSEPTDNILGGLLRGALTKQWTTSPEGLQLLFSADRAHHLASLIIPALKERKVVVCDRYIWSTIAYGSLTTETNWLSGLNKYFRKPNFTFLLKVSPEKCLERVDARGQRELFEEKEKLEKVWNTFEMLAEEEKDSAILNGERDKKVVADEVWRILEEKFGSVFHNADSGFRGNTNIPYVY